VGASIGQTAPVYELETGSQRTREFHTAWSLHGPAAGHDLRLPPRGLAASRDQKGVST